MILLLGEKLSNFFEGLINWIRFLTYFFSTGKLLTSLFSPWKGLVDTSKERGFTFESFINRLSFNLISRIIGFFLRLTFIGTWLVLEILYILLIPALVLGFGLVLPFWLLLDLVLPSPAQKRQKAFEVFFKRHCLTEASKNSVIDWFTKTYNEQAQEQRWWEWQNLSSIVPLARDWTMGYTPQLDKFATDLTDPAYQSKIKRVIGRQKEIEELEQFLLKTSEANVVLVGASGVGKHTILDAFAQRIYYGKSQNSLAYHRLLIVRVDDLIAQAKDHNSVAILLKKILQEASNARNVILGLDNLERLVSNNGEGYYDFSAEIAEFARTVHISFIGITTPYEYQRSIFPQEKIRQLFTRLDIAEVTKADTLQIIQSILPNFEKHYQISVPFETIEAILDKSEYFLSSEPFPEKAIELLDEMFVFVSKNTKETIVLPHHVDEYLTGKLHVPVALSDSFKLQLVNLEAELGKYVIHQDDAVHELASALRRAYLLFGKRKKPLASFLFLGPTGVGKTEMAKAITQLFFRTEEAIIRFDMSEYQDQHDIPKLIGTPDGTQPGLLTQSIRNKPYGVLLLDELEKAHPMLLTLFLPLLDEGYLTDARGEKIDAKNLIIIATSNAGAQHIFDYVQQGKTLTTQELMKFLINENLYVPEFLNRFDGVVAFQPLDHSGFIILARMMVEKIAKQILASHRVTVTVSDATLEYIVKTHVDPAFGARNLERALRNELEDKIAQLILSGKAPAGSTIQM